MYEQFKNEVLVLLGNEFNSDQLRFLSQSIDQVAMHYKIDKEDLSLARIEDTDRGIIQAYLVSKKIEGLADGTLQNYRLALDLFLRSVSKPFCKMTANDIRVYLFSYKQQHQISDRSLDKLRQYLQCFFSWAAAEGYLPVNPMASINPIKYEVRQRRAMTQEQLEYFRKACSTVRERAIVEFFYSTGCRIAELCEVKMSDLNIDKGTVHLFGKGKKHRIGFINAKAKVALSEYLKEHPKDCEYLFCTMRRPYRKISTNAIRDTIRKIEESAKIETLHVTPHVFRHTTATQALQSGMPAENVQKMLGHSNINTTLIYAEVNDYMVKHDHERYVV